MVLRQRNFQVCNTSCRVSIAAISKEQVDEHLESLTAVKDRQVELMEELKAKHARPDAVGCESVESNCIIVLRIDWIRPHTQVCPGARDSDTAYRA